MGGGLARKHLNLHQLLFFLEIDSILGYNSPTE